MTALLDINVLIALVWPTHVHHNAVLSWFEEHSGQGWSTCTLTESGFVRLSCNPAVVHHSITPSEAIALLSALRDMGSHIFWPLDLSIVELPAEIINRLQGYRQITDAVLLATAMQNEGQLVTLDNRLSTLAPESSRQLVSTIPV